MERRRIPRVPLDAPFFVTVLLDNGWQCQAMLVDCGRGGVQLVFSPMEKGVDSLLNQPLVIRGLPSKFGKVAEGWPGVIVWVSPERCGVHFDVALSLTDEEILEVANIL